MLMTGQKKDETGMFQDRLGGLPAVTDHGAFYSTSQPRAGYGVPPWRKCIRRGPSVGYLGPCNSVSDGLLLQHPVSCSRNVSFSFPTLTCCPLGGSVHLAFARVAGLPVRTWLPGQTSKQFLNTSLLTL